MVPIEISSPHSFSTSILVIGPSCTAIHNAADRRTDRATAIARLCYSIDSLKMSNNLQNRLNCQRDLSLKLLALVFHEKTKHLFAAAAETDNDDSIVGITVSVKKSCSVYY